MLVTDMLVNFAHKLLQSSHEVEGIEKLTNS